MLQIRRGGVSQGHDEPDSSPRRCEGNLRPASFQTPCAIVQTLNRFHTGNRMDASWMTSLNEQQRAAATFGDGPLLIIAGAGTGKTNTLAHRVAHLISKGVDPSRILLLTFTRRAAAEML